MSRHVIAREGRTPIIVDGPTDRALASLWDLAKLEHKAQELTVPATSAPVSSMTVFLGVLTLTGTASLPPRRSTGTPRISSPLVTQDAAGV